MLAFVYGTLKQGFGNNYIINKENSYKGVDKVKDHTLILSTGFPYMIPAEGLSVQGELYEVDEDTIKMLDALEGFPHHYQKKFIRTEEGNIAFTYYIDIEEATEYTLSRIEKLALVYGLGDNWGRAQYP